MGSFSDYWENEILDHIFGKGSYTPPTIYVGLSTADPGDDGAGLSEPSGNGYARVATSASDWTSATSGALENANTVEFDEASGTWGTVTHFALFDAVSGGHLLAHGALTQSKAIAGGDIVRFAAGDIDVSLD
ncbi:MAG: hypothetical protein JW993_02120 [Sedimentisphaerales bacterium]|nr:hypothetical protein [Sedimentisphaerales bacterium]